MRSAELDGSGGGSAWGVGAGFEGLRPQKVRVSSRQTKRGHGQPMASWLPGFPRPCENSPDEGTRQSEQQPAQQASRLQHARLKLKEHKRKKLHQRPRSRHEPISRPENFTATLWNPYPPENYPACWQFYRQWCVFRGTVLVFVHGHSCLRAAFSLAGIA